MKTRRLNLSVLRDYMLAGELCFIKPLGSKLHRLTYIPERYMKDDRKYTELVQVLNTICKRFHKGVYYFLLEDMEAIVDVGTIFSKMDILPVFIEPDGFGRDDNGLMIPEIFN